MVPLNVFTVFVSSLLSSTGVSLILYQGFEMRWIASFRLSHEGALRHTYKSPPKHGCLVVAASL